MNDQNASQNGSKTTDEALNVITFETALEELQAVVKKLESGELSLEQALQQFERGIKLTRACQERLVAAEQKVEILMKTTADGQVETQPFPTTR